MFAYCLDNPVNYIDIAGHDAEAIATEWGAYLWWLSLVDGVLPIGDIIYWAGWGMLAICAVFDIVVPAYQSAFQNVIERETVNAVDIPENVSPARNKVSRPPSRKVKINMSHILSGHGAGGNRGGPNKDRFPAWMSPAIIEKAIREAYENAYKAGSLQFSWENGVEVVKQFFRGTWQGGKIEFWYNYTTNTIETAWPK